MPAVMADTSAIYALLDQSDANHAQSVAMDTVPIVDGWVRDALRLTAEGDRLMGWARAT